jgi:hypothetical protein
LVLTTDCNSDLTETFTLPLAEAMLWKFFILSLYGLCCTLGTAAVQGSASGDVASATGPAGLPLSIVSATPSFLITPSAEPVFVDSYESIQIVFSRAVLPIGANGENPPSNHTPFTMSGSGQGTFRWLSSYVAEYGPEKEWLTDVSMKLSWNRDLITWDGAKLSSDGLRV